MPGRRCRRKRARRWPRPETHQNNRDEPQRRMWMGVETGALDFYESIADASEQLLSAPRRAASAALIAAEKECARRVAALRAAAITGSPGPAGAPRRGDIPRTVLAHRAAA